MAASTARSKQSVRLWWILNRERAGLVIVVLVLAAILALFHPVGRPTQLTGVVTAINVQDAKHRPPFNAWIDLGGNSRTIVGLPAGHGCVVGSRIALEKARFLFVGRFAGEHYAISDHGCDASPTPRR